MTRRPRAATRQQLADLARSLNAQDVLVEERAPTCALCFDKAAPRSRTLRDSVAGWLKKSSTPLCEKCEKWLSDKQRGLRPDGAPFRSDGSGARPKRRT